MEEKREGSRSRSQANKRVACEQRWKNNHPSTIHRVILSISPSFQAQEPSGAKSPRASEPSSPEI